MKWLFWLTCTPFGNMAYRMQILQAATRENFCLHVTSPFIIASKFILILILYNYCLSVWASNYIIILQTWIVQFLKSKYTMCSLFKRRLKAFLLSWFSTMRHSYLFQSCFLKFRESFSTCFLSQFTLAFHL